MWRMFRREWNWWLALDTVRMMVILGGGGGVNAVDMVPMRQTVSGVTRCELGVSSDLSRTDTAELEESDSEDFLYCLTFRCYNNWWRRWIWRRNWNKLIDWLIDWCGPSTVGGRFRQTLCIRWCHPTELAGRPITWRRWVYGGHLSRRRTSAVGDVQCLHVLQWLLPGCTSVSRDAMLNCSCIYCYWTLDFHIPCSLVCWACCPC